MAPAIQNKVLLPTPLSPPGTVTELTEEQVGVEGDAAVDTVDVVCGCVDISFQLAIMTVSIVGMKKVVVGLVESAK